jgi:hypothetical protein
VTRRIRIPGLIDVARIDEPALIRAIAKDPRLDREFGATGPLINRIIMGRVRRALHVGGTPLAAVAPRNDPQRAARQAALEARLEGVLANGGPAPDKLDALAAYVRGERGEDALGPAAQEAIGQLFAADFRASDQTWRAACILDAAPRTNNPLRRFAWALTGAVGRARRRLARGVDDDPAGVHAIGIAVHSLVRSLQAMRTVWGEPGAPDRLSVDAAVARSLRAPESVLRSWSARAETVLGTVRPGALAVFELDKARSRDPVAHTVFMTESWSRCPAHRWTATLLRAVWERAAAARTAS